MKKTFLVIIFLLLLIYPLYSIFQLEQVISIGGVVKEAQEELNDLQRSIWICWTILVILAVYYKWNFKRNLVFYLTYAFLFVAFVVFGIYVQRLVTVYNIPSSFEDSYTLGVFSAFQNIVVSGVLTGFLQAAVWWFTRRWHRR
jgi:di/tricarboxylate transporter